MQVIFHLSKIHTCCRYHSGFSGLFVFLFPEKWKLNRFFNGFKIMANGSETRSPFKAEATSSGSLKSQSIRYRSCNWLTRTMSSVVERPLRNSPECVFPFSPSSFSLCWYQRKKVDKAFALPRNLTFYDYQGSPNQINQSAACWILIKRCLRED